MADAAARVLVDDIDELLDRVLTVGDHVPRSAARRRHQRAVHHQQAVVIALEERLDDHRTRVLARHVEALLHFLVGSEADGDAAAMIAVVGLGDQREAHAPRGAQRLGGAVHQLLPGHRQPQTRENLVGFLLVAGELHGDVRGATGDGRLDALLVPAVTELHQRLLVQAQPWDAARFGGAHQRGGRGSEGAALREADELVTSLRPGPPRRHDVGRPQLRRQQRGQQAQPELAGRNAFVALRVLVDDGVASGGTGAARLAEGHRLTGDILQLDGHVLEHVAEPGAVAFAHAAEEAAGLTIRAAVFGEPRERCGERVDEAAAEPPGGPRLEGA